MSGLVGNCRRHILSCRGSVDSFLLKDIRVLVVTLLCEVSALSYVYLDIFEGELQPKACLSRTTHQTASAGLNVVSLLSLSFLYFCRITFSLIT